MRKITQITLGFENCESMEFNSTEIESIVINTIGKSVHPIGAYDIAECASCEELFIELLPMANKPHNSFGLGLMACAMTTFDRILERNDITSIGVLYDDGTQDEIYLPWVDDDDAAETNKLQKSYCSKNGALYVYVGHDRAVLDIIDRNFIDSLCYEKWPYRGGKTMTRITTIVHTINDETGEEVAHSTYTSTYPDDLEESDNSAEHNSKGTDHKTGCDECEPADVCNELNDERAEIPGVLCEFTIHPYGLLVKSLAITALCLSAVGAIKAWKKVR